IQSVIKIWCEDNNVPYRGYSSTEIKKFATGNGNASKARMQEAAQDAGWWRQGQDDNEVDAIWLLKLAQSEYDQVMPCPDCGGGGLGKGKGGVCLGCEGTGRAENGGAEGQYTGGLAAGPGGEPGGV